MTETIKLSENIRTDETNSIIYNFSFPDNDPETIIVKECFTPIIKSTTSSLVTSTTPISGPSSYVFGVSGKMKLVPKNISLNSNEVQKTNKSRNCTSSQ